MTNVVIKKLELEYEVLEAYRSLRTNLLFCGSDKKIISITSCIPNEGKSSVTLNLAISMAEAEKKVILIDADLRKSVLIGRIGVTEPIKGLSHYLSKQCEFDDIVCSTDIENLRVVFAGPVTPNPAELLSGEIFRDMLKTLRGTYDYILIDTPPLGNVIDGAIVSEICDGAILVIESGEISYRLARKIKTQLEKSNCPILGTVLNKVDITKQGYYEKKYGYKSYNKYG